MSARQEAVRLLELYAGPEADDGWSAGRESLGYSVEAYSLPGTVFAATSVHTLSIANADNAAEAWRQVLADLRLGVEPCTIPECEGCATD